MTRERSPRSVALAVLIAVESDDAYANLLLPQRIKSAGLEGADAGFATELTYGTLRRRGTYDVIIELASGRSIDKIDTPVLQALRIATHQLITMGTPAHAAVGETVEALKAHSRAGALGFANGVLRAISRRDADWWLAQAVGTARTGEEALAVRYSHPGWVVRAYRQALVAEGRESELEAALSANNVAPRVSLVALPGLANPEDLPGSPGVASPLAHLLTSGDPAQISTIREGRARVQDEGSQLAALALTRARPVTVGERWLDMCAGPGGKAALLAAEAAQGGATLVANELAPTRVELVRNALRPFGTAVEVTNLDGISFGTSDPRTFDRILVDAPCTGLGALRRRPEARWRKQPSDISKLGVTQLGLLVSAARAVKPGGLIAYVTCSPHAAETRGIVKAALREVPQLAIVPTAPVIGAIAAHPLDLPDLDHVQLWPHRHGTDAMYIQLLTRLQG